MWILSEMKLFHCGKCHSIEKKERTSNVNVPKNVNFSKNERLKMWILWKNETLKLWILWKNETLKMWILWKMRLWNCEFCEKWDVENVNFVKNEIFKLWILSKMKLFHWGNCHSIEKSSAHLMLMCPKNKCGECEFCQKWSFSIGKNVIFVRKTVCCIYMACNTSLLL